MVKPDIRASITKRTRARSVTGGVSVALNAVDVENDRYMYEIKVGCHAGAFGCA
jgi:hypothetical protein